MILAGVNGSQHFYLWAPPGEVVRTNVSICNAADRDVSAVVYVAEAPPGVRKFKFFVGGAVFGYDSGNFTEWRTEIGRNVCMPAVLELLVDGAVPPGTTLRVRLDVTSSTSPPRLRLHSCPLSALQASWIGAGRIEVPAPPLLLDSL